MAWDPTQYERFKSERTRPFYDLLDLVQPRLDMQAVDLGCGTGELTRVLHERLGGLQTVGVDNSREMLQRSGEFGTPGLTFVHNDIEKWAGTDEETWDLVFSNAALQWLPRHTELLGLITRRLGAAGQLAVQVPANQDHPSHVIAAELAAERPFAQSLPTDEKPPSVLTPDEYARLLADLGYADQQVRLQVYVHKLDSRDGVLDWVKGTLLTFYKVRLPEKLYEEFLKLYKARLDEALPDERPFIYPFKRILFWAQRP